MQPSSQRYEHLRKHLEALPYECQCDETLRKDDDGNPIIRFHCLLPSTREPLVFDCQAPSCGALELNKALHHETHVVDEWNALEEGGVDPHLFDAGYTLAGRTGFQVWAGARLLLEYVITQSFDGPPKVLELGAGVGLVGSVLAIHHQSSEILLTDLPTLVEHSMEPNLKQNQDRFAAEGSQSAVGVGTNATLEPPEWLLQRPSQGSDTHMHRFGTSFVATCALDWTRSVQEQVRLPENNAVDLILASDCVWLVSMLDSLFDAVQEILGPHTTFLLSFQKRENGSESTGMFTTVQSILDAIEERSWKWTCVAWKPVRLVDGQESEAFVFKITRGTGAA